jgi:hypothetical protein
VEQPAVRTGSSSIKNWSIQKREQRYLAVRIEVFKVSTGVFSFETGVSNIET